MSNIKPFEFASTMVGRRETPDRAAIQDYLKTGGANLDPATTAWCAAFVNASLGQSGIKGTGSNLARSFLDFGQGVDKPERGDIAVFSRGNPNGPFGHVGFFDSYAPDGSVRVLGGNQSDSVKYSNFNAKDLLGFRRPGDAPVSAPTGSQSNMMSPTPLAQQTSTMTGPAPAAFGDVVAPTQVATTAVQAPSMGQIAQTFFANQQATQQARKQGEAAEAERKAALFGDSLFGMYA